MQEGKRVAAPNRINLASHKRMKHIGGKVQKIFRLEISIKRCGSQNDSVDRQADNEHQKL